MDRKNLILGAVAGGIFLGAIIFYASRSGVSANTPTSVQANCACLACRLPVRVEAAVTEPIPYECPECGDRAVYPVLTCRECNKYFVPNLERHEPVEGVEDSGLPKMPVMPSCTACGSTNVGGYTGDEEIPADQLLLPKWPQ